MKPRTKKLLHHGLKLLGPILFAYVLSTMDLAKLWQQVGNVDLSLFAAGYLLGLPMMMFKAVRWRTLVRANPGVGLSFLRSYGYSLAAGYLGSVTPGRVGELYKISYGRARGLSLGRSAATVFVDRAFDLAAPLGITCAGVLLHSKMPGSLARQIVMVLVIAILAAIGAYMLRRKLRSIGLWVVRRLSGSDKTRQVGRETEEFFQAVKAVRVPAWALCVSLTLMVWSLYCGQRLVLASATGMAVDTVYFCVVFFVVASISMLPISVAGIGTRDAALIYFLSRVGISRESALVLASLILATMVLNTLVGMVVFLTVSNTKSEIQACDGNNGGEAFEEETGIVEKP